MILLAACFAIFIFGCKNGVDIFGSSDIELVQLTFSYNESVQDWSPDGKKVIFTQKIGDRHNIWTIDLTYRDVESISTYGLDFTWKLYITLVLDISWHPIYEDIFVYQDNGNLSIKRERITPQQLTNSNNRDHQPVWSPDGNKIAFTRNMEVETIWSINADGSDQKPLTTSADRHCFSPSFSYDGTKIVYIKSSEPESEINEIWVMNFDGSNKQPLFAPGNTNQSVFKRAWNQNDKIIFSRSYPQGVKLTTASDLWIINADGSGASPLLESFSFSYENPIWNIQGNKIALNVRIFMQEKSTVGSNVYYFPFE